MVLHWAWRTAIIGISGFGFYILTGNGSITLLGIGIVSLLEFRYTRY